MTSKQKLQTILKALKTFLKKKEKQPWITPKDKRFTSLVKKYEPKLSSIWEKTRKSYIDKFKEKDFTDFDENPDQYEDPSYDSSQYIDSCLNILQLAFGDAVLVGYKEMQSRGIDLDIPSNLNSLFATAQEIRNYEWAALSYEQKQMDDIFDEYNKTTDGKDLINKWFDENKSRLTELILGGLIWYGTQFGFTRALIETQGPSAANLLAYWITKNDNNVCVDCAELEDKSPYSKKNPLPTLPGGGKTLCGSKCRCVIDYE